MLCSSLGSPRGCNKACYKVLVPQSAIVSPEVEVILSGWKMHWRGIKKLGPDSGTS